MKNKKLHQWLWRWHFIAGMITLPFVLVLAITGTIYLFHPQVESKEIQKIQNIEITKTTRISYEKQWAIAKDNMLKKPNRMIVNSKTEHATEFISGKFGNKESIFINQYTGKVTGKYSPKNSWMYSIRKLHGELLGGNIGTKIVELIASWMIVLLLTGIYIWFPFTKGIKGFINIRCNKGKSIFFKDLHAVTGFWMAIIILLILAGGLPWTDVFGGNFKLLQKWTNTGYPKYWNGKGLESKVNNKRLPLAKMVAIAKKQNLHGEISIVLPQNPKSIFSVFNKTTKLKALKKLHFDQYSGALIKKYLWKDIGLLMRGRLWLMTFHQGQFGIWNWWLIFISSISIVIMSLSALTSYLYRKSTRSWNIPKAPKHMILGKGVLLLIVLLGTLLPLFGISILILFPYYALKK